MDHPNTAENSSTREITDRLVLENLARDFDDRARLRALSDFDLIRETLNDCVADDNRVLEMMDRIYPRWFDEPEAPAVPAQPRSVSVAVPFGVAVDLIAHSDCHCDFHKPCLFCLFNAALYRATKLEHYKPETEGAE